MELNDCDKAGLFPGLGVYSVFNTEKVRRFEFYPKKSVFKNSIYEEGSYQFPTHSPVRLWCSFFEKENIYLLREYVAHAMLQLKYSSNINWAEVEMLLNAAIPWLCCNHRTQDRIQWRTSKCKCLILVKIKPWNCIQASWRRLEWWQLGLTDDSYIVCLPKAFGNAFWSCF